MASGVKIRVSSDSKQAQRDLRNLESNVLRLRQTADRVTTTFNRLAIGITAAFAGTAFTRAFTNASDSITNLENRVSLVVGKGSELQTELKRLYRVAAEARQPVSVAADTFNRFGLALQEAGVSSDDLIKATSAVQKAATISGASAQTASASIIQLGQGLASGELRGQELNSVLEGIPRLAQAIAKGMGIPFGELREQAKQGKVTAEAVFKAILERSEFIEKEFASLDATVGGLAVVMRDELGRALTAIDREILGISGRFSSFIITLTKGFRNFADFLPDFAAQLRIRFRSIRNSLRFFRNEFLGTLASLTGYNLNFDFNVTEALKKGFSVVDETVFEPIQKAWNNWNPDLSNIASKAAEIALSIANTIHGLYSYLPTFDQVSAAAKKFYDNFIKPFADLFMEIIGNSYWTNIFGAGTDKPGINKEYVEAKFNGVVNAANTFKTEFVQVFKNMANEVEEQFKRITNYISPEKVYSGPGNMLVQTNESSLVKDAKSGAEATKEWISSLESVNTAISTISGLYRKFIGIQKVSNVLNAQYMEKVYDPKGSGVMFDVLGPDLGANYEGMGAFREVASDNPILNLIAKFQMLGKELLAVLPTINQISTAIEKLKESFVKTFGDVRQYFTTQGGSDPNSEFDVGPLAQSQFRKDASKFADMMGVGLDTAFAGVALGIAAAFVAGIPAAIIAAGGALVVFGLAETGLLDNVLRSFGRGIGNLLTMLFSDQTAEGAGGFASAFMEAISALGEGINETFDVPDPFGLGKYFSEDFKDIFIGGITAAIIASALSSKVRGAALGLGAAVGGFIKLGMAGLDLIMGGSKGKVGKGLSGLTDMLKRQKLILGTKGYNMAGAKIPGLSGILARSFAGPAIRAAILRAPLFLAGGPIAAGVATAAFFGWEMWGKDIIEWDGWQRLNKVVTSSLTPGEGFKKAIADFLDSVNVVGKIRNALIARERGPRNAAFRAREANYALGGYISGAGTSTSDSIPARLSNGEFVVRASAVQKYGVDFLNSINSGMIQSFSTAGLVGSGKSRNIVPSRFRDFTYTDNYFEASLKSFTRAARLDLQRINKEIIRTMTSLNNTAGPQVVAAFIAKLEDVDTISEESFQRLFNNLTKEQQKASKGNFQLLKESLISEATILRKHQEILTGIKNAAEQTANNTKGETSSEDSKKPNKDDLKLGEAYADRFTNDIKSGFSNALKTGNFEEFFSGIANSLTSKIIDSFVDSFVDNLFGTGENNFFKDLFANMSSFGRQIGSTVELGITSGAQGGGEEGGVGFISKIFEFFKSFGELIFGGIQKIFSGFGGSSGGGSNPFSWFSSFLGMNQGGYVPALGGQRGIDSVPAMLTPGELVIPANRVGEFTRGKQQTIFNLNITGDVSRQTRSEIVKMLPEITNGVNFVNKENNFRGQ